MRPYSGGRKPISIAANTRRLDVDNRISLKNYYRIANNLLKQADVYREENNVIDLYIMLLRFSSLITETIPQHRDYQTSLPREKLFFRKKSLDTLTELEMLKPIVKSKLEELNRNQLNGSRMLYNYDTSLEWPPTARRSNVTLANRQSHLQVSHASSRESKVTSFQDTQVHHSKYMQPILPEDQLRKLSLSLPRAKDETLSRHSILGPNGLHGQWQPSTINIKVEYPSSLDLTPVKIPWTNGLQQKEPESLAVKDTTDLASEEPLSQSVPSLHDELLSLQVEVPLSAVSSDSKEMPVKLDIVRQPSPPPVLADLQDIAVLPSLPVNNASGKENSLEDELLRSKSPLQVHISTQMMDNFMRLARSNTQKNLETCGVLAGSLKNRKFYVTALIIPKQESTSDTCQTTNEEEIFDYQDKQSLFPLGWIHTHPTQSCFMSSVDVHTHYSYQVMLPEAIAIVMAPRDSSRTHGIFRLTAPGGMSVIRKCQQRGFHAHEPPMDGGPIYEHCSDVYMNPNLKFDVVDFR